MFWIALAAQLTAPEPQYMWLSDDDTPVHELPAQGFTVVRLRLTIPPDGRVHRCEIEQSSGNERIDRYTCDLARKRALFRPAQSAAGTPTYGVYRVPVVWTASPITPKPRGDVLVRLSPRPKDVRLPAIVSLMFAVDATGRISGCRNEPPALRGMNRDNPTLVPVACDQLVKNYAAVPAKDENGELVPSSQNAVVLFTED